MGAGELHLSSGQRAMSDSDHRGALLAVPPSELGEVHFVGILHGFQEVLARHCPEHRAHGAADERTDTEGEDVEGEDVEGHRGTQRDTDRQAQTDRERETQAEEGTHPQCRRGAQSTG